MKPAQFELKAPCSRSSLGSASDSNISFPSSSPRRTRALDLLLDIADTDFEIPFIDFTPKQEGRYISHAGWLKELEQKEEERREAGQRAMENAWSELERIIAEDKESEPDPVLSAWWRDKKMKAKAAKCEESREEEKENVKKHCAKGLSFEQWLVRKEKTQTRTPKVTENPLRLCFLFF